MIQKVLRRSFFLPFLQKLLWIVPCAVLGSLFFLGAHLAAGAGLQAKQSSVRYYESHALAHQNGYRPSAPDDIQGWWPQQNLSMRQLDAQEFVRGYTRRTKLAAFIVREEERIPIDLILIEEGDEKVFPPLVQAGGIFPENTLALGIGLSAKHGFKENDMLSIAVPALSAVFTNQKVEKIYNVREAYLQNYTVFMPQRTASPFVLQAMRSYHVRFSASPFTRLLISNTQPLIPNSRMTAGSDSLSYALGVLERLKDVLFEGYLLVNFLAGLLYAFALYRYTAQNEGPFRLYCKRNGFAIPSLYAPLAFEFLQAALLMGLTAGGLSLIFEKLPFEFLIFSPYTGLFPEFSLKVSQGIVPLSDFTFLLKSIPWGILVFTLSAYGLRPLLKLFESKEKEMSALIVLLLVGLVFSYGISRPLLHLLYAKQARDSLLYEHYFGGYSLTHKYGDQALSFKAGPPAFPLRKNTLTAMDAAGVRSFTKLQASGEIVQTTKINQDVTSTNRLSVTFIGLRGSPPPELQDLIEAVESNQIVVGGNIQQAYPNTDVFNFHIYGAESNIMVSLPASEKRIFDIPYYNNCVFMNIDTLAAYLGIAQGSASVFLGYGGESLKYLEELSNPDLLIRPFKQRKVLWTAVEEPIFFLRWLVFFVGMAGLVLILTACFTASAVRKREIFVYGLLWRKNKKGSSAYFTAAGAVMAGALLAALSLIPSLLVPGPLPEALNLDPYTPALLAFKADVLGFLLVQLALLALLALGYGLLVIFQTRYYHSIMRSPRLPDSEENNI